MDCNSDSFYSARGKTFPGKFDTARNGTFGRLFVERLCRIGALEPKPAAVSDDAALLQKGRGAATCPYELSGHMTTDPFILRDDAVVRIGAWNSVLFQIWRGAATPSTMREVCDLELDYAKKQPRKKFALVSIVRVPSYRDFGSESRHELEKRMQKVDPFLLASVVLLPTQSLGAAIVRAIITGLALLNRSSIPSTVTGSADEACSWLALHLPPTRATQATGAADVRLAFDKVMGSSEPGAA